jgi:hypothetical protein
MRGELAALSGVDFWLTSDACRQGGCRSQMGTLSVPERAVLGCFCRGILGVPCALAGDGGVLGSLEWVCRLAVGVRGRLSVPFWALCGALTFGADDVAGNSPSESLDGALHSSFASLGGT